jgi:hypothetical protein
VRMELWEALAGLVALGILAACLADKEDNDF